MKFTVSRITALAVTSAINEINALNGTKSDASGKLLAQISALNQLENFNVSFPDRDIQLEINDEIVLRYLALYIKTAKLLAPLVTAATSMWDAVQGLIKTDCEELVEFTLKRKE